MKASKEQRAGMSDAVLRLARGANLPARMRRLKDSWHPSERAPGRIQLTSLTPTDVCAHGVTLPSQGQQTFFITAVELRDASDMGEREFRSTAGAEALRLSKVVV